MNSVAFPELPYRHEFIQMCFAARRSRVARGKNEHDDHDDDPGTEEQRALPPASSTEQRQQTDHKNDQSGIEGDGVEHVEEMISNADNHLHWARSLQ